MKKTVLISWGGWSGHEPEQTANLFAGLLRGKGLEVTVSDTLESFKDAAKYDLIIPVWTMSSIDGDCLKTLQEAVKGGVGIGGWHGGAGDSFRASTDYQWIIGGQWVAHPGNAINYHVDIVKNDPITQGITGFDMVMTEQYYMHTDPGNEVLATTTFTGEHAPWTAGTIMPVAWKRHYGAGRVYYCSLGHGVKDFDNPSARELTLRGLLWAAGAL